MTALAAVVGVLMTIIGVLLMRSISHIDDTIKGLVTKVERMSIAVNSGEQLRNFQDRRIRNLEHGKEVLTDAFHEVDVLLQTKIGKRVRLRRAALEEDDDENG